MVRSWVSVGSASAALLLVVAALPWLRGEDPAQTVLRVRFRARGLDDAAVAALREELTLPANPVAGTIGWLTNLFRGDLGESWVSGQPVTDVVAPALGRSALLAGSAVVVAVLVVIVLLAWPVWRSMTRAVPVGHGSGAMSAGLAALPEVVVGIVTVLLFAVTLQWLPATGWGGIDQLVLPAVALGIPAGGLLARIVTSTVDQTLAESWVASWRVNRVGRLPLALSIFRRVVATGGPQAVVVAVTILGSSVAVEKVFAIHGAGTLALGAVLAQDLPVVQACLLGFVLIGLMLMLLSAVVHRALMRGASSTAAEGMARTAEPTRSRIAPVAAAVVAVIVVVGLRRDGSSSDLSARLRPPSWAHPLGTDPVGHDLLGRVSSGTLLTVGLAVAITGVSLLVAILVGLPARSLRLGGVDVLNAVPSTIVGVVVASIIGPGLPGACVAVLAVAWVPLAIHARTLAVQARAAGYVEAASLLGASRTTVTVHHILPAVLGPLLRHALVRVPAVALGLAGLSFIGLGADPDVAELGAMLSGGLGYLETAPWVVASTAGVLVLLGFVAGTARLRSQ